MKVGERRAALINGLQTAKPEFSSCRWACVCISSSWGQLAAGFVDGSIKLFDIRPPKYKRFPKNFPHQLVCAARPHARTVERVVGIGFQPGLDPAKAGEIQFLDMRNDNHAYLTIDAHRGSLTALAVQRHAPLIASGAAKQFIEVFSLEGSQLCTIRFNPTSRAQKIGPVSCLTFHPYQVLLAAGAADALVSIYANDNSQA